MSLAATIGLAEAKNKLSELLDRVERGEEFTITRHDEAVARLVPAKRPSRGDAKKAIEAMRALRAARPESHPGDHRGASRLEERRPAMSADFVLDCSVTMTWFFPHEATRATDELQEGLAGNATAIVPLHWRLEVGNVLLSAERKKSRTRPETEQFLALLSALSVETDGQTDKRAHANILSLARDHRLTTYDAAYLDLAMSRGVALASLDKELRAAAKKLGVEVLPAIL